MIAIGKGAVAVGYSSTATGGTYSSNTPPLRVEEDVDNGFVYVHLARRSKSAKQVELRCEQGVVVVDLNEWGQVVGVEFMLP